MCVCMCALMCGRVNVCVCREGKGCRCIQNICVFVCSVETQKAEKSSASASGGDCCCCHHYFIIKIAF